MKKVLSWLCLLGLLGCQPPASKEAIIPADYQPAQQLEALGITLPAVSAPVANYVNAVQSGHLLFLAGKGPGLPGAPPVKGKLGSDMDIEAGYAAAREVGIKQLAVLQAELGDLRRVKRIVKVVGMVNSTPDFTDQPKVVNGFSDLMVEVFGERGKHARAAVGMASLPNGIPVEIDLVVELY